MPSTLRYCQISREILIFLSIFLTFTENVGIINAIRAIIYKFIAIFLTSAKIAGIIKDTEIRYQFTETQSPT